MIKILFKINKHLKLSRVSTLFLELHLKARHVLAIVNVLKFGTFFSFCSQTKCWIHKIQVRIANGKWSIVA